MNGFGYKSQRGASLVEMLVVLVVVGILVTFAVAQFGGSKYSLDRQNIAKQFKVSLERARFDSVKRHANTCANMSNVTITGNRSFTVSTDDNQDGVIQASETRTIDFSGRSSVQIVENPAPTYPVIIRFDERGNTSSGPCTAPTAVHTPTVFCTIPCTAATAR